MDESGGGSTGAGAEPGNDGEGLRQLEALLEFAPFTEYAAHLGKVSPKEVARSLARLLTARDDPAVSMVIEKTYIDRDYTAAYYMQGVRSFSPLARDSTRVHFFSRDIGREMLEKSPSEDDCRVCSSYLGFAVVRPGAPPTLGRTFIRPPSDSAWGPMRGADREYSAGLMSHPLRVRAAPYMSQDQRVLACATAALWMANTPVAALDASRRERSTTEITRLANDIERPYGPGIGSAGLAVGQMERALVKMGYDPFTRGHPRPEPLREACVAYADSGMPPILTLAVRPPQDPEVPNGRPKGLQKHAITVVGYEDRLVVPELGPLTSHVGYGKTVGDLLIHDDQRGMYLPASLSPLDEAQAMEETGDPRFRTKLEYRKDHTPRTAYVSSMLVPAPSRIMVDVASAWSQALAAIPRLPRGTLRDAPLIYRALLVQSNDFKSALHSMEVPDEVARLYYHLPMPRYVWLVEFSYADRLGLLSVRKTVEAEILIDSTRPSVEGAELLAMRTPARFEGHLIRGHNSQVVAVEVRSDATHRPYAGPSAMTHRRSLATIHPQEGPGGQ